MEEQLQSSDDRNDHSDNTASTPGEKIRNAVLALARLIGRRIAREEFEKLVAANDNRPTQPPEGRPPGTNESNTHNTS
ncbi:hypothetical protein [Chelativorans sp.]|uniref:hypothetical protein n=1 Tax=Chelativorans sp. TaxID=2203393 RepID=UPI002810B608|nr:hypothetical protein [Chelativorans sp.]